MFSGIKSIFFGYSETSTDTSTSADSESVTQNDLTTSNEKTSFSHDTSALIEQTLNAATTKFTEQLLPQSPSIEQLQSSSRQLLPTLNEQHEEDETKRKKQVEGENLASLKDDEDDDCFNADSWELLDLVEKSETSNLSSTVPGESAHFNTSGILKQSSKKNSADKPQNQSNQRQKPKVSFDTPDQPDLVNDKPKLGRKKPKGRGAEAKSTKVSCENKKENKKTTGGNVGKSKLEDDKKPSSSMVVSMISYGSLSESAEQNQVAKKSVLNYAAALSMNLKSDNNKEATANNVSLEKLDCPSEEKRAEKEDYVTCRGAVKRNRPVSTSSWSSDELETLDSKWDEVQKAARDEVRVKLPVAPQVLNSEILNEDNESVVSSGFSDCDYGYEGINDYVMRPKKSQNKKRRGLSSTSNWLANSVSKRNNNDDPAAPETDASSQSMAKEPKTSGAKMNATSSKSTKSKKKKLSLSTPTGQSGFRKLQLSDSTSIRAPHSETISGATTEAKKKEKVDLATSATLMPPPPPLFTTTGSSAGDSSDLADMDESWYVTPPPCFTGTNKHGDTTPPAKEAARENALIEHPSIYIPMAPSRQQKQDECLMPTQRSECGSSGTSKKSLVESRSKPKAILLRKVGKQVAANTSSNSNSMLATTELSQTKRKSTVATQPVEKKSAKAWENKFIVTNWSYDEQDDINDDFDNLFGTEECALASLPKSGKTSSAANIKAKKAQLSQQVARKNDSFSMLEMSTGYESDVSIPAPVDNQSDLSNEILQSSSTDNDLIHLSVSPTSSEDNENIVPSAAVEDSRRRLKSAGERKAPILVRPLEPERQPGWQLRKKRAKRRPLSSSMTNTCNIAANSSKQSTKATSSSSSACESVTSSEASNSNLSSARSTPTLIDRISSSIVANLTNLTSGFPAASLPIQARASIEEVEKLNQTVSKKANSESVLVARRRMAKGYLDRQNNCAKVAGCNRRADRRLKMHCTPNGYSIDRKVQTNFH